MILELCNTDLLALSSGNQVAIGDLIVRSTNEDHSSVVGQPIVTASTAKGGTSNSRQAFVKTKKTGRKWMSALFAGTCAAPGCPEAIKKGDNIVYDYDKRAAYCAGHGVKILPREGANA